MKTPHTPTPWREDPSGTLRGADGENVVCYGLNIPASMTGGENENYRANTALIYRAVNAHDDLVSAAERLNAILGADEPWNACGCFPEPDALQDAMAAVTSALAKARGGS